MTTAYVADRAREMLDGGWVREVVSLPGGKIHAKVGGYTVTRLAGGKMGCDCAATHYGAETCSHREALRLALESS